MIIDGQKFETTKTHLILKLNEPWWGAWQRFGWEKGTEGYSINEKAVIYARDNKKKILIKNKYGNYEISAKKAITTSMPVSARNGTELLCIPRTALKKIPKPIDDSTSIDFNVKLKLKDEWIKIMGKGKARRGGEW